MGRWMFVPNFFNHRFPPFSPSKLSPYHRRLVHHLQYIREKNSILTERVLELIWRTFFFTFTAKGLPISISQAIEFASIHRRARDYRRFMNIMVEAVYSVDYVQSMKPTRQCTQLTSANPFSSARCMCCMQSQPRVYAR